MMATIALLSALSAVPAQEGQLRITNERTTYCMWGAPRPGDKYIPGDVYFLNFDIENLATDKSGKVRYRLATELLDKGNKSIFKSNPEEVELVPSLGTRRIAASSYFVLGTDIAPGEYTAKVEVEDLAAKKKTQLAKKFEVAAKEFGIVRINTSFDFRGEVPAPWIAVPGQAFWVNFAIAGFKRDEKSKQPNIALEWRIVDENGKPTFDKPIPGEISERTKVEENYSLVPAQFGLTLNRAGKFTVELKAVDKLADKTATLKFPITVTEIK